MNVWRDELHIGERRDCLVYAPYRPVGCDEQIGLATHRVVASCSPLASPSS
jgi:hypothetical protein